MLPRFLARIRAWLRRREDETDLRAELQYHLEKEIARNLERGLSPVEARHTARRAIGNLTTHVEDSRAATIGVWTELLAQDIRYIGRGLRRNPVFTLIAVLSLGFGIGATTTVFSTIDALDFREPPFRQPERLLFLGEVVPLTDDACPGCPSRVSVPTALDWLGQVRSYVAVGAMTESSARWTPNDATEQLGTHEATPGFFRLLGVALESGRDFLPSDTLPGAVPVVIVTHDFWERRLGGDPAAIGRPLPSSDRARTDEPLRGATVIGVLPRAFRFGVTRDPEIWTPLRLLATSSRTLRTLTVVGRLRPGVTEASAGVELRSLFARLAATYPDAYRAWGVVVEPLRARLSWGAGRNRRLLFGITALVLLVAIVNVAGLFMGRASTRRQEFAMRSAFGASRPRLLRQMLVEGTCVGLGGGLTGALLAWWGIRFSSHWFGVDTGIATMDVRVLAFVFLLSLVVGIVTALGPAFRASRVDLISDLRGKGVAATTRRRNYASGALIIAQIALGLVLLSAAAALSADFIRVRYADLGFDPSDLFVTSLSIPRPPGKDFSAWRDVAEAARERVASIPGVRSAALEYRSAAHPDIVRPSDGVTPSGGTALLTAVDPGYFATLGMRILRGRSFGPIDGVGGSRVALVNRSAAARFWPGQDPVGHQVFIGDSGGVGELLTVVGVSADAERAEMVVRHWPVVYRPLAQATLWHTTGKLQVRLERGADRAAVLGLGQAQVRDVLQSPVDAFHAATSELDDRVRARRFNAIALDMFAVFGLLLAAMGVYGAVSTAVTRRTREIGVRIALGAGLGGTLRLVVRREVVLASAGVALGLLGAFAMSRVLRSLVAGVSAFDARVFATAAAVMLLTAGAAALLPARRALRVDPVDALRAD